MSSVSATRAAPSKRGNSMSFFLMSSLRDSHISGKGRASPPTTKNKWRCCRGRNMPSSNFSFLVSTLPADALNISSMAEDTTLKRYVRRGTNPIDDPYDVLDAIENQKSHIVVDGKIVPATNKIWQEIKNKYGFKKSAKALHTFVSCNKWDVQVRLGLLKSTIVQESPNISPAETGEIVNIDDGDSDASNDANYHPDPMHLKKSKGSSIFKLYIPKEKWRVIEPEERTFVVNEFGRRERKRKYTVLKPGIWTDVVNSILWDQLKWRCCWRYKGNYVSMSDLAKYWIIIRANCACGNEFVASAPNPPPSEPRECGLTLTVTMTGSREAHTSTETRQVKGQKRKELGEEMVSKKLKASYVRKIMASDTMSVGDPYPAHIPSNEVMRKIKSENIEQRRLDHGVYKSVQILKYSSNPVYQNAIYDIGLDPFFIHIWTPNQVRIYSLYCKRSYSRLILDATGQVVHKVAKPKGNLSSHIFLYLGVVMLPGKGEGLVPVVQMISERHNADAIEFWLKSWLRVGNLPTPKEVVLDDSAALISACCRVFDGEVITSNYIAKSMLFLQDDNRAKPKVLLRIDVARFTNMIRKWPEISRMRPRTKEFYIRCIVLVAMADNINTAEELLEAIFVVALSETEGNSTSSGQATPCEIQKRHLFTLISGLDTTEDVNSMCNDELISNSEDIETEPRQGSICDITEAENVTPMKTWIERVVSNANKIVKDDGDRDNIMYEPVMVTKIKQLCYILPLWCNALAVKMRSPFPRAIGAYVENAIGQIKSNLAREKLRVDDFLVKYLTFCDGSLKLAGTMEVMKKKSNDPLDQSKLTGDYSEVVIPPCPACTTGNIPEGAHKCVKCKNNVHALEGCSVSIPGEEEGFGERRLCVLCRSKSILQSSDIPPDVTKKPTTSTATTIRGDEKYLCQKTSIVDRPDLSLSDPNINTNVEPTSVEGWRGLSVPQKKRQQPYYWTPNSDFPLLFDSGGVRKVGVLKNGTLPTLKLTKVGLKSVSLSNTCSFDAPAQIIATAYCDSKNYREEISKLNVNTTIIDVSVQLATKGTSQNIYKLRSKVLCKYIDSEQLKSGVMLVNCAIDSSILLRKMEMPPSMVETRTCTSPYCPAKITTRSGNVLSAEITGSEISQDLLEASLSSGDVGNTSICLKPMVDMNDGVPEGYVIINPDLSDKGPLCSGTRTREVQIGCHLIVEMLSGVERIHTDAQQFGVFNTVKCRLSSITRTLTFCGKPFYLRGVVAFKPPLRDSDAGHYLALSLRIGNKWEVYDDLKPKVTTVSGEEEISVHLLLFTV